jgi:uncharacterized protein (DUF1330 family)
MKGYWVVLGTAVSDPNAQAEYSKRWKPIAEKFQARVNPLDVPPMLKEARDAARVIIVEFPSLELAKACYDDPAYQEAKTFALQAAHRHLLIVEGELS